jgi:hypothetical protein
MKLKHYMGYLTITSSSFYTTSSSYFPPNISSKGQITTITRCNVGYGHPGKQSKLNSHQIVDMLKQPRSSLFLEILWSNLPGLPFQDRDSILHLR